MSSLIALSSLLFCGRSAAPLFTTSESTASLRHNLRPVSQEELLPSRSSRKSSTPIRAHPAPVTGTGRSRVRFLPPPPSTPPAVASLRHARHRDTSQADSDVETDSEIEEDTDTENNSEGLGGEDSQAGG